MAHCRRKGTGPALSHPPGQGRSATMKTAGHASVQCRSGRFPHPENPPFCNALVDCRNWVGSEKWAKVVRQTRTAPEHEAVSLLKAIEDASRLPTERLPQAVKRQQSGGLGRRPGECRRFCGKRRDAVFGPGRLRAADSCPRRYEGRIQGFCGDPVQTGAG